MDKIKTVTIKNSAALQEEVSTKKSDILCEIEFLAISGDYNVHVAGGQNFAYQGMRVKYGEDRS